MNGEELTREEALQVVQAVCSQYKGTLMEHEKIQSALRVLRSDE